MGLAKVKASHSTTVEFPKTVKLMGEECNLKIRRLSSARMRKLQAENVDPDLSVRSVAGNAEMADAITDADDGTKMTAAEIGALPQKDWTRLFLAFMEVQAKEDGEVGNA